MQHQFNLTLLKSRLSMKKSGVMIWYLKSPVPPQTEPRRSGVDAILP
jgi:hypothetical protein